MATQETGETGHMGDQKIVLALKPPKLDRQHRISSFNLKHQAYVKQMRPEDLGPKKAKCMGEKVREVDVGWGVEVQASLL